MCRDPPVTSKIVPRSLHPWTCTCTFLLLLSGHTRFEFLTWECWCVMAGTVLADPNSKTGMIRRTPEGLEKSRPAVGRGKGDA